MSTPGLFLRFAILFSLIFSYSTPTEAQRNDDPPCCFCSGFPLFYYRGQPFLDSINLQKTIFGHPIELEFGLRNGFPPYGFTIDSTTVTGPGFTLLEAPAQNAAYLDSGKIRVRFSPTYSGYYKGVISVYTDWGLHSIVLNIQASGIEVIQLADAHPALDGQAFSFEFAPKLQSGTAGMSWVLDHNADSLYLAKFAPVGNSNSEPHLFFIKAYYPGSTYSNTPVSYDGFTPSFSLMGGINFVAYMKPGYDEYRTWDGNGWSGPNTSLHPFFTSTTNLGNRMEVAIPWSAIVAGGGLPDSIQVVCYQTNGNQASIFSYAQLPPTLSAGANSVPLVNQGHTRIIKNIITESSPYRFQKTQTGSTNSSFLFLYNPGDQPLTFDSIGMASWLPAGTNAFTISNQPVSPISPKKTSRFQVDFHPNLPMQPFEAVAQINNNTSPNAHRFKLTGSGVGSPDMVVQKGDLIIQANDQLSFGEEIPVNTDAYINLKIRSIGGDTLFIGPGINPGSQFSLVSTSLSAIPPGDSSTVRLKFAGSSVGTYDGLLKLNPNLPEESFRINLHAQVVAGGAGIAQLQVFSNGSEYAIGDTLTFPDTPIGQTSNHLVWLFNPGTDTLRVDSLRKTGTGYALSTSGPVKIAPNDSNSVLVSFHAAAPQGPAFGKVWVYSNADGMPAFELNLKAKSQAVSRLEILQVACNLINTSGAIGAGQLPPKLLVQNAAGIKWYASWDTAHFYLVKFGGNRAEPQLIYLKAHYPGATFSNTAQNYDNFQPDFTGIGGINFVAYLKEGQTPYDEFRTWNGTGWSAPDAGLQPNFGNQGPGGDVVALRIPWRDITRGNGIPDSLRFVLYQTNGNPGNIFAYAQSPTSLPAGATASPVIGSSNFRSVITRLQPGSTFDFGNCPSGTTLDTLFLLQNRGTEASAISVTGPVNLTGSTYSASLQTVNGALIQPGKWVPFRIRFAPGDTGNQTGTLLPSAVFDFPDIPYLVNFKGRGIPPPAPSVTVKAANFILTSGGVLQLGVAEIGTPLDTSLRIINYGQDTLRISNLNFPLGWNVVSPPLPRIAPGDSTAFRISRDPVTAGLQTAQFGFATNVTGQTNYSAQLWLTGDSALRWFPPFPTINDSITITLNTALGNKALRDSLLVFIHTGVITSGPTGTAWSNVQGNFSTPDDSVRMTRIAGNQQAIKLRIRDFYNLSGSPQVYRLGMVFRNRNGAKVGRTRFDGDFFIPVNPALATAQIKVTLNGAPLVNNSVVQFGAVPYGETRDTTVVIRNTGTVPLTFSLINVASFSFQQIGTTPLTYAPGDSGLVHIQLNSNGVGPLEGFLNLLSNASNSPSLLVNLSANGFLSNPDRVGQPAWSVYPNPVVHRLWLTGDYTEAPYYLTDVAGRVVQQGRARNGEAIPMAQLPAGAYQLHWTAQNRRFHQPVMKQ